MSDSSRYKDASRPVADRVQDLLEQMTLDEKLAQLGGVWVNSLLDEQHHFSPDLAQKHIQSGIGHITRVAAATGLPPTQSAELANSIQTYLVEETRLGIPAIVHEESCAGYMARGATTFPQAIGLASTWDPALVTEMADVIRRQMRAVGAHQALAPMIDVTRDPRWGRVEETFGEDPYLISELGVAYIRGLQGQDLRDGVAATAKHFIGYGLSEGGRNWAPARIPQRELLEQFTLPFEAAIREANVASVMNAYHEMDGVPCGASEELMMRLLRNEFGFDGVVVSDYFTIDMLHRYHQVAQDKGAAAVMALQAGIDVELPAHDCYGSPLQEMIDEGKVDMRLVDASVARILTMKFQLGLFENPYVDTARIEALYETAEQRDLSRRIAERSFVLLKNAPTEDDRALLPLSKDLPSIAVIGPCADSIRLLQGDYHYPTHIEIMFEAVGTVDAMGNAAPVPMHGSSVVDLSEHFVPTVTVLEGIRNAVSAGTEVRYAQGCAVNDTSTEGFEEAVGIAREAAVAIVVVGDKSGLTPECTSGESIDRANVGLPGVQEELVKAIHATGTPVVVVLVTGKPLALSWIAEHVPAVLMAWLPAEEAGNALANVLFGNVSPSGKLPMTLPRSAAQIPVYYNHKPSGGRTHWRTDYRDMPTSPLFAFGHGLSYTRFAFSDLQVTPDAVDAKGKVIISATVANAGDHAGDEVVQLYTRFVGASVTRPVKELKGFKRLTLEPGESKRVEFELAVSQLAFYDEAMTLGVQPGRIQVMLGAASDDIRLEGAFDVTGEATPLSREARVLFSTARTK